MGAAKPNLTTASLRIVIGYDKHRAPQAVV